MDRYKSSKLELEFSPSKINVEVTPSHLRMASTKMADFTTSAASATDFAGGSAAYCDSGNFRSILNTEKRLIDRNIRHSVNNIWQGQGTAKEEGPSGFRDQIYSL